jgi:hypothetical protein
MGSGHDGFSFSVKTSEYIARTVTAVDQAGLLNSALQPGPGFKVRRTERGPAYSALGITAEAGQIQDVLFHAFKIYGKPHRFLPY